jgi:hypothetical protein
MDKDLPQKEFSRAFSRRGAARGSEYFKSQFSVFSLQTRRTGSGRRPSNPGFQLRQKFPARTNCLAEN